MNISYGSLTATLVSLCTHCQPENKQSNFKMNINTMWKTKKFSQLASLMEASLNFMIISSIKKIFFSKKVGDK